MIPHQEIQQEIPERYPNIDLLLIHLGGTTIPGPHAPLLMVVRVPGRTVE